MRYRTDLKFKEMFLWEFMENFETKVAQYLGVYDSSVMFLTNNYIFEIGGILLFKPRYILSHIMIVCESIQHFIFHNIKELNAYQQDFY